MNVGGKNEDMSSVIQMEDPKSLVSAPANGFQGKTKTEFFFGQPMIELVKSVSEDGHLTAIEKVKINEFLGKGLTRTRHLSDETSLSSSSSSSSAQLPKPVNPPDFEAQLIEGKNRLKKASILKDEEVSLLLGLPPPIPPLPPLEKLELVKYPIEYPPLPQVDILTPFQAEKLGLVESFDAATLPHIEKIEVERPEKLNLVEPIQKPPPPPPPKLELVRPFETQRASKVKKLLDSKKGLVAPNGLSAREELMMAIRCSGGAKGLRKTQFGQNK